LRRPLFAGPQQTPEPWPPEPGQHQRDLERNLRPGPRQRPHPPFGTPRDGGRHIMEKTGNVAAVQRQLGHRNAAYSLQYARITEKELNETLDDRE
ncbi:MAG: hypothetical protein WA970_03035, partial [Gammaproteobacteria bacterium]